MGGGGPSVALLDLRGAHYLLVADFREFKNTGKADQEIDAPPGGSS
jgi:hypothetical protein